MNDLMIMQNVDTWNRFDKLFTECENLKTRVRAVVYNTLSDCVYRLSQGTGRMPRSDMLSVKYALKVIDAQYWSKAMNTMKIMDYLPNNKRIKWHESLENLDVLEFTADNVKNCFSSIFLDLPTLFAERVTDIFRRLSREHFTNQPDGFRKRMILYVFNDYYTSLYDNINAISDLRSVVQQISGKEQLSLHLTRNEIEHMRTIGLYGEWVRLDDWLRIKIFKKGTAHLEVSEEVADKLNSILAAACADQLPPSKQAFYQERDRRHHQKKSTSPFDKDHKLLNGEIINYVNRYRYRENVVITEIKTGDNRLFADLCALLGGEKDGDTWKFNYNVAPVLRWVCVRGVFPDYQSYQFYPTPKEIVNDLAAFVGDVNGLSILEPNFGAGSLVSWVKDLSAITAVDISPLACQIATEKGCGTVKETDFISYHGQEYDLILMNPPYTRGQAKEHFNHAKTLLKKGGRIFAVLPQSAISDDCEILRTYQNAFEKTNITTHLVRYSV